MRSVPYIPVGTSLIKLPMKQMELWQEVGFTKKNIDDDISSMSSF
jgi:hypothetical protein